MCIRDSKGKKFRFGGSTSPMEAGINKQKTHHGKVQMPNASLNKYVGMKKGGEVKHDDIKEDKKLIKRAFKMHDEQEHKGSKGTNLSKLKKGGMSMDKEPRRTVKGEHSVQTKSKRGAEIIKMAKGGLASGHKSADGIAVRGKTKNRTVTMCGGGTTKKKGK